MTLSPPADQYFLSGTFNFRDIGGLRTTDGGRTRPGVLLRSAQLSGLDDHGRTALLGLGVTAVHDLRGPAEIDTIGHDALPEQIRLLVTPFDTRLDDTPPHEARTRSEREHMLGVYRAFPERPEAHRAIVALATAIADGDGAVLVHCAAGKDRTGWAVATLLRAVGVTEEDVLADYMASAAGAEALRRLLTTSWPGRIVSDDLLGVFPEYLRASDEAVLDHHGSFENYLLAAGLGAGLRDRLRARLLAA
ncbi:tyrosine-protein phosphatase [Nocardia thailandica]|uniref:Tyrosine-protein phosphatase n=1 Tax=Nocardia thailandica TaxID=257275 RepID=A0ABW6PKZ7_9NOCA